MAESKAAVVRDQHNIRTTNTAIDRLKVTLANLRNLQARRRARVAAAQGRAPAQVKALSHPLFGLDYATPDVSVRAIRSIGATFVCRYLASTSTFHNPKDMTQGESVRLRKGGIARVVVWETTATRARDGHRAGVQDAEGARREAQILGMPSSRPIYFAVDEDVSGRDVAPYFEGVAAVLGKDRTGVYGGIHVVRFLFDNGLVSWGWQTYAWSQGQWDHRAQLQQYSNDHNLFGVGVDYDRAMTSDYGQW